MTPNEFSHVFEADKLGPHPKKIHIEANTAHCTALSERFNLTDMAYLKGHVILERVKGKKIHAAFHAQTQITQNCVVTFKPVQTTLDLVFERFYEPSAKLDSPVKEIDIDSEDTNEVDPIIEGKIDLAEALCEELGLDIDPHPRVKGSQFNEFGVGPDITEEEIQTTNPFAVLAGLNQTEPKK